MPDWTKTFFGRDYVRAYPRGHQTESQVEAAVRLLGLSPPLRILDLCCGYGRHTLALRRRGYPCFGLDLSQELLKLARKESREEGAAAPPFTCADMREIPYRPGTFDAVLSLFTSFGYFEEEADDQAVLNGVARALRPGGRFLLDVLNKEWLMAHFTPRFWEEGEGTKLLSEMTFDYERGRLLTRRTIVPDEGERKEFFSSIRLYTLAETVRMLRQAGLTYWRAFGDYDGRAYDREGFRMIVVAEKE
ncbi:MAG: class I SAM-dependent methyltransferase [Candidatus Tectomicrobia bacterium]|nr:class I SAM-dependent methyltransferase [Candidatus Tectomicrobia bacterium]